MEVRLGNGLWLYPAEAIGGILLTLGAAIRSHFDGTKPAVEPVYSAVILAVAGLLLTIKAAPIMLGIGEPSDGPALRQGFEAFYFRGTPRGVCQVLSFVLLLCALALLRDNTAVGRG